MYTGTVPVEVNAREHTETCAVPAERVEAERSLLRSLPMLRTRIGRSDPQGRQTLDGPSRLRVNRSRRASSVSASSASASTAAFASTPAMASWSPITPSSPRAKPRCAMSTTRHRAGRRRAGHVHPLAPSASSSRWDLNRTREAARLDEDPGRACRCSFCNTSGGLVSEQTCPAAQSHSRRRNNA